MRITMREKLKMCKLHIEKKMSLSHISEMYGGYHVANIKYTVNLYKRHGEGPFLDRQRRIYKRDTKLLAIGQVLSGRSLRDVAVEHALTDPGIVSDWVKKYKTAGEDAIEDTYPRANYLLKEDRFKAVVDKKIEAENERLRGDSIPKKIAVLSEKTREGDGSRKSKNR